ncbi:heterocyst specific ABC-transporter, ATP-binding subunit DevA homolog [Nostoc sp. NIES-2111]|nr:heterocyst specific ABC-transporter, ATP-binding subunit DevA homolog [Nostoc sp. NIES-2111]
MNYPTPLSTVTVTNLNHAFGQGILRKPVLTDIDLAIYPSEIVILTGPSGSGKTTLLSLIGGLRSVQEGSLKIFKQELKGCNKTQLTQIRNQIGFIFQHHNLLKCLTAYGNVRMSLKLHPEIPKYEYRQRGVAILDAVGLGDRVDYYPEKLSGGQKQRVAIARALVAQPKLVLADEPTSSLDSKTGRDVVDIIQRLAKEEGCSVLLVTHDARILDIADRIVHMEDGRLQSY